MDWNAAIERHRNALKRVLAALAAMAGFGDRQSATGSRQSDEAHAAYPDPDCLMPTADCRLFLPRHLHRAVLRLLRPAEAAVRRLVIVTAREVSVPPPCIPPCKGEGVVHVALRTATEKADAPGAKFPSPLRGGIRSGGRRLALPYPATIALPLFDPLRRTAPSRRASTAFPRISIPGWSEPAPLPVPHTPYDPIDARRLTLRLAALARALDDLPREARRFARWRSRSESLAPLPGFEGRARQVTRPERGGGGSGVRRLSPLRGGAPPGQPSRRRPTHEIHRILDDVHGLAFWALEAPDTS